MRIIEGQRCKNVTLCLAVSPMIALIHWMTFDGGITRDIFGNFLMGVSETLQYNDEPCVLLCDNVSSHLNPVSFGDQGEIMHLPKYSPFLSMAEIIGSCAKASLKKGNG